MGVLPVVEERMEHTMWTPLNSAECKLQEYHAIGCLPTAFSDAASVCVRYVGTIAGQDFSHALTAGVRITWLAIDHVG
jgi:hypothetical protein